MTPRRWRTLATVGLVALGACRGGGDMLGLLPAGPEVVEVEMQDYRFVYDRPLGSGRALFKVRNVGTVDHDLTLFPLTDDIPPIDEQLRGSERRAVTPQARVKSRPPGTSTTFAADLAPGVRYALVCFVRDGEGQPHFVRGMSSEFRAESARGRISSSTEPTTTRR